MKKRGWKWSIVGMAVVALGALAWLPSGAVGGEDLQTVTTVTISMADCFGCHAEVEKLHNVSKHAKLGCETCHTGTNNHLVDPNNKPVTSLELSTCGSCHKDQYNSYYRVNYDALARNERGIPIGRSPYQDKLLAPHGVTKEHNEPRSHPFMVVDQIVVDRFAAGRYQFKDMFGYTRPGKAWDVLVDTGKTFPKEVSAASGNPVCLQCKTSDLVFKWKFMGDKDPKAKWDRTSDINELIKDVQNPVGCIQCHDPHAAKPRIIRDALIDAIEREGGARPYDADKGAARVNVAVVSFRAGFRKIGLLDKPNSTLQCGQCHVEYNCNGGFEPESGDKVTMADRRTNHFPMKNARDILAHYDQLEFRDFRHAVTGARLIKLQHPEMETFWGSVHDLAGVTCSDCHMPKEINKSGKSFTLHELVRPKDHVKQSCQGCHPNSTGEEKLYQINAVQNYTRGKILEAEATIVTLIDTYAKAKEMGVSEEILAQARMQHEIAHVLWDWWSAENSEGWHNPLLAKDSLFGAIVEAKKGTDLLLVAMAPPSLAAGYEQTVLPSVAGDVFYAPYTTYVGPVTISSQDMETQTNSAATLESDAARYIAATAYNALASSTNSNIEQLLIDTSTVVPLPPVLSLAASEQHVVLAWTAVPGATGYVLSYAPIPNTGTGNVTWVDLGDQTSYAMDFWTGAAFAVAVTAYNSVGESAFSNIASIVIGP